MSALSDRLLQPISDVQPCGPDLSNDGEFDQLRTILKGKPEIEVGNLKKPAEPPDWSELKNRSIEFLGKSRHLEVAVMLCASSLKTDGLSGFVDGLQIVRGLLENFWSNVFPALDPDIDNDPGQRLNILGALTAERGSYSLGWLTIVDFLYTAPIYQAKGVPPLTYDDLLASKLKATGDKGAPANAPDPAKIGAVLRGAGDGILENHCQALRQALEATQGIDQFLVNTIGAANTISFEVLEKALREMISGLSPFLPGTKAATETTAAAVSGEAGNGGEGVAAGIAVRGSVRSRDDVVNALERICDYYSQVEPCSPVPYLLRRAQMLARMDFVQAVQELNIATIDSLKPIMGSAVEGTISSGGEEPPPPSE
jgi:type VI secretion system protein ImpA